MIIGRDMRARRLDGFGHLARCSQNRFRVADRPIGRQRLRELRLGIDELPLGIGMVVASAESLRSASPSVASRSAIILTVSRRQRPSLIDWIGKPTGDAFISRSVASAEPSV
jgi:hypothetical protein